jgi:excisionase family DNA binding protein
LTGEGWPGEVELKEISCISRRVGVEFQHETRRSKNMTTDARPLIPEKSPLLLTNQINKLGEVQFYRISEVAALLKTSPKNIKRMIRAGKLKALLFGQSYVVSHKNLLEWLETQARWSEDEIKRRRERGTRMFAVKPNWMLEKRKGRNQVGGFASAAA